MPLLIFFRFGGSCPAQRTFIVKIMYEIKEDKLFYTDIGYNFSFLSFRFFLVFFLFFSGSGSEREGLWFRVCFGDDWVCNEDCMGLCGWWRHSGQIRSGWGYVEF